MEMQDDIMEVQEECVWRKKKQEDKGPTQKTQ